ncbi:MAG: cell division protein SepF [Solirubrobacterales bacterium]
MAIGDTWRRALEYFGLVDGDYIEEGEYTDEHDLGGGPATATDQPVREPVRESSGGRASARRRGREMDDVDDIFGDDDPPPRRRRGGGTDPDMAPVGGNGGTGSRGGSNVQMKLVSPRSFNDAQKVADEFKASRPVILNMQDTDPDLARRLIDFASGLTYALGGGMQKIADQTFLLTPQNVSVSAAEAERMLESGFFNQA